MNFTAAGFYVIENKVLNLSGVKLVGTGYAASQTAILCERGGLVMNSTGEKLVIQSWNTGIMNNTATAYLYNLTTSSCMYSIFSNIGSCMYMTNCNVSGNVAGAVSIYITNSSNITLTGTSSISNSTTGIYAQVNSTADITGATYSGNGTNASPAVNTLGNINSYIYKGS
jgi:hypothetical protein